MASGGTEQRVARWRKTLEAECQGAGELAPAAAETVAREAAYESGSRSASPSRSRASGTFAI